eukprot:c23785_g1_i1 orf=322-1581(-)
MMDHDAKRQLEGCIHGSSHHRKSVEIPHSFMCPISLDVMRDPVTIWTGHTYDREFIRRWFDEGHNTCPLTMQIVEEKTLIPNHMLRSIIQNWLQYRDDSWMITLEERPASSQAEILSELRKEAMDVKCSVVDRIRQLAKENECNKSKIMNTGAISLLISLLLFDLNRRPERFFASVGALAVLPLTLEEKREVGKSKALCTICSHLLCPNFKKSLYSLELLTSLAEVDEVKLLISQVPGTITSLLQLLKWRSFARLVHVVLRLLSLLASIRSNRLYMIRAGIVETLTTRLSQVENREQAEHLLNLLQILCTATEGRAKMLEHPVAVPAIVRSLTKLSESCSTMAIDVLWAICEVDPEEGGQAIVRSEGIVQLLLVIQSNCSSTTKYRAVVLLKLLRGLMGRHRNSRNSAQNKLMSATIVV